MRWALTRLDGETLASGEKDVRVEPSSVLAVEALDFAHFLNDDVRRDLVFVAELWPGGPDGGPLARQTAYFVPTKHLSLVDPHIEAEVTLEDGLLRVELSARSLARLVECRLAGADVVFGDNYFDLPAGQVTTLTAPLPAGWDLDRARAALQMRSVYDTYAH
ncbi:MAG: hypothetical protein P8129_24825 [Anaerolineae bacterium]